MSSRDEALRADLHELFLEELDEHLERLEHGLDEAFREVPTLPEETVSELFRSAHSLKGAASAVGASAVSSLCHDLEDTLVQVRDGAVVVDHDLLDGMVGLVDQIAAAGGELRRGAAGRVPGAVHRSLGSAEGAEADGSRTHAEGSPVTPEGDPSTAGGTEISRDGAVRVSSGRLDALLAQAGDLIAGTYRSELFVEACLEASEHLSTEAEQGRRDRDALRRVLGGVLRDSPHVREILERMDSGARAAVVLDRLARSARAHQAALRGMATRFAESVLEARMVPFTEATAGLTRIVRDLAAEQGKQASLVVDAAAVEVDKQLVATLHDVLGHAVRNAVAHGIEPPEERRASGKPAIGSVTVKAVLRTDGIAITVTDDGRGVDAERVRERVAALGLASDGDSEPDLVEALFHAGLSTATEVTGGSGRGVGLDAIRAAVESTGGAVRFHSRPGEGARLDISVPLTLSTLRVLLVLVDGDVLAVPTSSVIRLIKVPPKCDRIGGREVVAVDDRLVPLVPLAAVLGWSTATRPELEGTGVLVDGPQGPVVLVTDELVSEREVVLRTTSQRLAGMTMLLGTAQLEDGSVALVLSTSVCARAAVAGRAVRPETPQEQESRPARVLLVEDTVTTRELERSILVGAGYDVAVAVDGQQAWEMLQARDFDVVVSDVNMPRMDGIGLCRSIRESRHHHQLPVVLVTSLHSDADRHRGLEAGADAYLTKAGFDRAQLLATLERVL